MPSYPTPTDTLHRGTGHGRALCDSTIRLDARLSTASPECRGMYVCPMCHLLDEHLRREARS